MPRRTGMARHLGPFALPVTTSTKRQPRSCALRINGINPMRLVHRHPVQINLLSGRIRHGSFSMFSRSIATGCAARWSPTRGQIEAHRLEGAALPIRTRADLARRGLRLGFHTAFRIARRNFRRECGARSASNRARISRRAAGSPPHGPQLTLSARVCAVSPQHHANAAQKAACCWRCAIRGRVHLSACDERRQFDRLRPSPARRSASRCLRESFDRPQ